VTDVTDRAYDTDLLDTVSKRADHGHYFEAGADAVETKYVRLQSG
jgi:hypothetical protein